MILSPELSSLDLFKRKRPNRRPSSRRFSCYKYSEWAALIFLTIATVFGTPSATKAEQTSSTILVVDKDRLYEFAQSLYRQKRFIRAAAEFERFAFFYPDDALVENAYYQAAKAYFKGEHYKEAINVCNMALSKIQEGVNSSKFYLLITRSEVQQSNFNHALVSLHNLLALVQDPIIRDEAYYLGASIFIQTGRWAQALEWLHAISSTGRDHYSVETIEKKLATTDTIQRKYPRLAGALAVIPGVGHLYTGRYQDALISVLLNTITVWSSIEAFDNDLPALGSLMGLVGFNFYVGNIYSAINSAYQFNRRANEKFIDELGQSFNLRLSIAPVNDGGALMVQYHF